MKCDIGDIISLKEAYTLWTSGKARILIDDRKFTINRMNYGDYFLEPEEWKGGETEGFAPNTIWLKNIKIEGKPYYIIDNEYEEED